MSAAFETFDSADVRDLIAEHPLAWVLARGEDACLLPLLGDYDAAGRLTHLFGHMARRNPLVARLTADPSATILFNGPQGYVSPAHAGKRDWGPTWNYAQLTLAARVTFVPNETGDALDALTTAMEGDRWSARDLGARYDGMAAAVIAFRAEIISLRARFKLGQDEQPETFATITERHPDAALVRWMRRVARPRG